MHKRSPGVNHCKCSSTMYVFTIVRRTGDVMYLMDTMDVVQAMQVFTCIRVMYIMPCVVMYTELYCIVLCWIVLCCVILHRIVQLCLVSCLYLFAILPTVRFAVLMSFHFVSFHSYVYCYVSLCHVVLEIASALGRVLQFGRCQHLRPLQH